MASVVSDPLPWCSARIGIYSRSERIIGSTLNRPRHGTVSMGGVYKGL